MRLLFLAIFAVLMVLPVESRKKTRTSQAVRREQRDTRRKIAATERRIAGTKEETRRELLKLQTIEGEMAVKNREKAELSSRVAALRRQSRAIADSVEKKEERLQALRISYSKALRAIRRHRHRADELSFVLSSSSFTQARSRVRYLKELGVWEKEKSASLKIETQALREQKHRLDSMGVRLTASVDSLAAVTTYLREQKHQADAIVSSLRRQGRNLTKVLEDQQRLARRLDDELNRIIEEEARLAAEEARRRAAEEESRRKAAEEESRRKAQDEARAEGTSTSTPKEKHAASAQQAPAKQDATIDRQAADFAKYRGHLPRPIDKTSTIVSTFGRHTHESYSKVQIQNNGIDFETSPGASAIAVHPGVVSMVIVMDGYKNVILVRHGEYLTVYAGIERPAVRKGQQVAAGQPLGLIYSDAADGNRTRLHFEVRHEKEKLDPAQWLRQ